MNLVLDEVARQLPREFVLIWVDGGSPDVFVLTSPERVVAVWSTRHLELSAAFRALLVDDAWSAVRVELAERLVLKVVAELSLRDGDSEVAANCLLGAVVGQRLSVADSDVMADLDVADPARMDEAYMALWFMGLAHEFGHGLPAAAHQTGALSDEAILRGLREGLESMSAAATFPFQPGEVVAAAARDPAHPLHPGHVRGEVVADVFGVSVVLQATVDLMARVGARQPDPLRLIAELLLSTAVVSCIERSSRRPSMSARRSCRNPWPGRWPPSTGTPAILTSSASSGGGRWWTRWWRRSCPPPAPSTPAWPARCGSPTTRPCRPTGCSNSYGPSAPTTPPSASPARRPGRSAPSPPHGEGRAGPLTRWSSSSREVSPAPPAGR